MPKTDFEWSQECNYCNAVALQKGRVREMNFDTQTFIRYVEMQRDTAAREGFHDTAEYLQFILDDLQP